MQRPHLVVVAMALLLVIAMCGLALATGDLVGETQALFMMPWGRFVLADVTASFLLLAVFVQLIEQRLWISVLLFLAAALAFGSFTYAVWMLLRFRVIFTRYRAASGN